MVRPEVIRKRLNKLDECLAILHRLQAYPLDRFLSDPLCYGSAERFLQLAIETTADMGSHVIAESGWGPVNHYADIAAILAARGFIPRELEAKWVRMIGFRNILVHDYLEIDRSIVYDVLQCHLADLEALRQAFAQLL